MRFFSWLFNLSKPRHITNPLIPPWENTRTPKRLGIAVPRPERPEITSGEPLWSPVYSLRERKKLVKFADETDPQKTLEWTGDEIVAMKTLPQTHPMDEYGVTRVQETLFYDRLIRLVDYDGFDDGKDLNVDKRLYWEYCDKGSLRSLLSRHEGGLEEDLIWHVLRELLRAVVYLHTGVRHDDPLIDDESGPSVSRRWPIVHCQINPDNIHFSSQGRQQPAESWGVQPGGRSWWPMVKLGNFSKVAFITDPTPPSCIQQFKYTKAGEYTWFEAPELSWYSRFDPVAGQSDMWSIAAVAVAMMGGLPENTAPTFPQRWSWKQKSVEE